MLKPSTNEAHELDFIASSLMCTIICCQCCKSWLLLTGKPKDMDKCSSLPRVRRVVSDLVAKEVVGRVY